VADERTGFLGRWSRRKADALQGRPLDEPAAPARPAPGPVAAPAGLAATAPPQAAPAEPAPPAPLPEKLLSLEDAQRLTQGSDFRPFMARNVGADVRNAAMKKLFADPHYNVMDGLDIYIDDYSIADPLPEAMLRQMASAQFLNLFDAPPVSTDLAPPHGSPVAAVQDDTDPAPAGPAPAATGAPPGNDEPGACAGPLPPDSSSPHPSAPGAGASHSPHDDHAHPHLRLQPDHAPSAPRAGGNAA